MTPATVHHGRAEKAHAARRAVLAAAYAANPERFVRGAPRAAHAADGGVDQQARDRGGCSLNSNDGCLIFVDRYRSTRKRAGPLDLAVAQAKAKTLDLTTSTFSCFSQL